MTTNTTITINISTRSHTTYGLRQQKKYDTEQIKKMTAPLIKFFYGLLTNKDGFTGKQVLTNIVCKGWSDTKNEISIIQKYNTTERWSGHPLPDRLPVKKEVLDTVSFPCERSILFSGICRYTTEDCSCLKIWFIGGVE